MLLCEGVRLSRKHFEDSVDPTCSWNGKNNNRPQAELAADLGIDADVVIGVVADLDLPTAQALAGDSGFRTEARSERRRHLPASRPADHHVIPPHGDG